MLKKAGIVVVGAAAGVMTMSGVAFAGDAPGHSSGSENHHGHHEGHHDSGRCGDKLAASGGHNLVDLSNVASNLDLSHVNILASDDSHGGGCHGHGDKAAVSGGHNLVDASNLLANADVSHVNVLAQDSSS